MIRESMLLLQDFFRHAGPKFGSVLARTDINQLYVTKLVIVDVQ